MEVYKDDIYVLLLLQHIAIRQCASELISTFMPLLPMSVENKRALSLSVCLSLAAAERWCVLQLWLLLNTIRLVR